MGREQVRNSCSQEDMNSYKILKMFAISKKDMKKTPMSISIIRNVENENTQKVRSDKVKSKINCGTQNERNKKKPIPVLEPIGLEPMPVSKGSAHMIQNVQSTFRSQVTRHVSSFRDEEPEICTSFQKKESDDTKIDAMEKYPFKSKQWDKVEKRMIVKGVSLYEKIVTTEVHDKDDCKLLSISTVQKIGDDVLTRSKVLKNGVLQEENCSLEGSYKEEFESKWNAMWKEDI